MITREQATATLADFEAAGLDGRIPDLARTVVALHDEVERLRAELAAAQDLARRDAERAAAIRAAGEATILDVKHHRATFGTGLREAHEAVKAGYRAPKGWKP